MSTTAKTVIIASIFAASITMAPVLLATTPKDQAKHPAAAASQMTQGKMMQGKKGMSGMMSKKGEKGMSGMQGKKGMSGMMSKKGEKGMSGMQGKKGMSGTMNKKQMMKKMAKMHKMMHKMMSKCHDMDMKGAKSSHHGQVKHAK